MKKKKEENLYIKDAQFYDLDNREVLKTDIPFYIDYASNIRGDILELACGTGRVTIPLAKAGFDIWGIELSETMLNQLRSKMENIPYKYKEKLHLIKGDISNFKINRKFSLILLPCRSFQLLYDEKNEINCLRNVHEHLIENGHFIIDVADFVGEKGEDWVNDEETFDWENIDPNTGYKIRRTHIKKKIDTIRQIIYPQKTYYITKEKVLIDKIVKISPWKYFKVDQVRNLLISNGFKIINEMGSFDRVPINQGTEFIFICKRKN